MKSVNIAKFKAELGKYLSYIRLGEEVIVYDRKEPLAKVIPFKSKEALLSFEEPLEDPKQLMHKHYIKLKNKKTDSLKFLLEDRGDR